MAAYVSRGEICGHGGVFFPIIPSNRGHGAKKDIPMLNHSVSFMYNPEAPFGLELMAERKPRGHALHCYNHSIAIHYRLQELGGSFSANEGTSIFGMDTYIVHIFF
jgi:hypothetical protein